MSKYSDEMIEAMAKSVQWYRVNQPEIYLGFLLTMSMHTGLHPETVERKIEEISRGDSQ